MNRCLSVSITAGSAAVQLVCMLIATLSLVACGGGSSSSSAASNSTPTPVTISGTVAAGTALTGTVSLYDSSANAQPILQNVTIGTAGQYSATITGFTAPFLLQATGQVGGQGATVTLYSVATAAGTVDITPLTTLMVLNIAGGNVQTLMSGSGGSLPSLTTTDLSTQNTNLDNLLSTVLPTVGLTTSYNFVTETFSVGSTGYDQLLDDLTVTLSTPSAVTVTNNAAPGSAVTIDTADGSANGTLDITTGPTTLPVGTLGPVSVPNVVGLTQAEAATAITGAGLAVGTVTQQSSPTKLSGDVISESPAANTSVATGSAVALVISTGPAPGMLTFDINGSGGGTITGPDGSTLCERDDSLQDALPANVESEEGEVVQPDTICTVPVPANDVGGFGVQGQADVASEIDGEEPDGFYLQGNNDACVNPEGGDTAPYLTATAPCVLPGNVTETVYLTFKQTTFTGPLSGTVVAGCESYQGSVTLRLLFAFDVNANTNALFVMGFADLGPYCGRWTWTNVLENPGTDQGAVLGDSVSETASAVATAEALNFPQPTAPGADDYILSDNLGYAAGGLLGFSINYILYPLNIPGTLDIGYFNGSTQSSETESYSDGIVGTLANPSVISSGSFTISRLEAGQDQ